MNAYIDATILNPNASKRDFEKLCADAIRYQFPAVCVPPYKVEGCRTLLSSSDVKVATVIGFPAGYQTIPTKIYELRDAIERGAQEIDYVIHRGYLADRDYDNIEEETLAWVTICREHGVLSKWIIEASEQDEETLTRLIGIANRIQPDYVKTSTGVYGKANRNQVQYLRERLLRTIKIKAAGGISDRQTAQDFITVGADRLGVSQYLSLVS